MDRIKTVDLGGFGYKVIYPWGNKESVGFGRTILDAEHDARKRFNELFGEEIRKTFWEEVEIISHMGSSKNKKGRVK